MKRKKSKTHGSHSAVSGSKKKGTSSTRKKTAKKSTRKKTTKKSTRKKTAKKSARKKTAKKTARKKTAKKSARKKTAKKTARKRLATSRIAKSRPKTRKKVRRHTPRAPRAESRAAKPPAFKLEPLDPEKRAAVDELLVRVYQQAARDLREQEQQRLREIHNQDEKLAQSFTKARQEIMRTLSRWEKGDAS